MSSRSRRKRDGKDYLEVRNAIATTCEAMLLSEARKGDGTGAYDRAIKAALKGLIWLYSEQTSIPGDAYFSCPFWSAQALAEYEKYGPSVPRKLFHFEHVFPRENAELELKQAKTSTEIREVLDKLQTCTILREEHDNLPRSFKRPNTGKPGGWWQRYSGEVAVRKGPHYDQADKLLAIQFDKTWHLLSSLQDP